MSEIQVPVKTVQIHYVCDECGKGRMRATGRSNTGIHEHRCDECGHRRMVADVRYPHVEYIEIHEPTDEEKFRDYERRLDAWREGFAHLYG